MPSTTPRKACARGWIDADPAVSSRRVLASLAEAGAQRLARDGFPPARQSFRRAASARYVGQSSEIEVPLPDGLDAAALLAHLPALFAAEHERTYGFRAPDDEAVELIGLSVIARGTPETAAPAGSDSAGRGHRARQSPRLVCRCRLGRYAGGGSGWVVGGEDRAADHSGIRRDVPGAEGSDRGSGWVW